MTIEAGGTPITPTQLSALRSTLGIVALSAGGAVLTAGTMVFSNSHNVSFGLAGSVITASVPDAVNLALSAGAGSQSSGTLVLADSNGVSFGMNAGTLTAAVRTDYLTTAALSNHSHGNPSLALTNLSGSTASNSAGLTISLSAAAPGAGGGMAAAAGTQTGSTGTLVFANSNGMSFGMSASSQITASYTVPETSAFLTTAALSNHSHGNPTLALTNLNGTTASASNGLTLSLSAAAQSVQTQSLIAGIYDGVASISSGTLRLSNSNGISFGINGQTLTASHNGLTTAALSDHSHGNPTLALTNLSGTTASNSAGLTLSLSAAAPDGGIAVSVAGSSLGAGTLVLSNSNGISFGLNGSTITASHNALTSQLNQAFSAANGSNSFQTMSFADGGGVSWSTGVGGLQAQVKTDYFLSEQSSNFIATSASSSFAAAAHNHTHSSLDGLDDDAHPRVTNELSTTLLSGGEMSVNADPTKFDVAAGVGLVIDNFTDPENPTRTLVTWSAQTGLTDPYLATDAVTAVGINSAGVVVYAVNSFTDEQRRDIIYLGSSNHVVGDVIESADAAPAFNVDTPAQLQDFFLNFGAFNIDGNEYSPSSLLTIQRTAGKTFAPGTNYINTRKSPNVVVTPAEDPVAALYYYYQSAPDVWVNTDAPLTQVDPDYYDTGSGKLAVASGKWTIQTLFFYAPWQTCDVQYGQVVYDTLAEAEAALSASIEINPWIGLWDTFRSWLIVQQGCIDVADSVTAKFVNAGKLGLVSVASGGGAGGEVNTASNDGDAGVGVFNAKVGVNLGFKNIVADSPRILVSNDTAGKNVRLDVVQSAIAHSALSGLTAYDHPQYMATSNALVFSNSNGISFGTNALTVTASHNGITSQTVQTQSNVQGLSAGTQVGRTGDIVLANSNGITFGMSGSSQITASYTVPNVPAQTAQTLGLYGSSQTYGQSSSSTFDARSLSIVGSGGVSVGMSAGSLLISGQTTAAQTVQSIGLYASSQTFGQSSSSTVDARSLSVVGSGGVSVGMSAGSLLISGQTTVAQSIQTQSTVAINGSTGAISFANSNGITFGFNASTVTASHNGITSQTVQTQSNVQGISAGTQVGRTGDIVFSNSNGISFGLSGSNTLTASYTVPSTAGLLSAINLSAGTTSQNLSAMVFSNSNGMSFGLNGSTVTGSYSVPGATVFSNSNNVSFGLNGSTVTATATFAQTAQTMGIYGSSQTYGQSSSSTIDARSLSVVGSGGISVGMSAGSLLISGQTTVAQSAQTQSNVQGIVVSNTTYRTGDVSFSNLNGISFGSNGANVVTASYTVPTQSAQTIGLYASSQTVGQSSSSTVDARSLTVVGMGGVSAGLSAGSLVISGGAGGGVAMSAGTQSVSTGTMVFANSNGITFGMSGSSQITASHNGLTTQSNQVVSAFAASNTTQSTTGTFNASSMIIAGAGVVSVGVSNGSIVISAPSAAASPVNVSAGTTSGNIGSIVFSNSNGVSFGLNGSTVTASAAAGGIGLGNSQTTYTSGNAIMSVVGGAMTIASTTGQSFNFSVPQTSSLVGASGIFVSTNGSTISVYQPLMSYFANGVPYLLNSQTQTVAQSTSVVFPMQVREAFSAGLMRMAHTVSLASTSFASTAASAYSYNQQETHNIVLYSLGTGASSQSLQSFSSSSVSFRFSINVSQNTTNNISVTHGLTFPVSNGTSSLSFSYAATNSTMQVSTTHMTALSGMKLWDTQFAASIPTGRMFMAYGQSTTQTTQGTAGLSACRLLHSQIGMSQPNNTLGFFGVANNASVQWQQGIGSLSVAGGGTTASLNLSQISSSSSHIVPYVQMVNQA